MTSYHRKKQEKALAQKRFLAGERTMPQHERARPFPLVRPINTEKTIGIFTLIHNALDSMGARYNDHTVLLRGAHDKSHALAIIALQETFEYRRHLTLPSDHNSLLADLAQTTNTSDRTIRTRFEGVGIFGGKQQENNIASMNIGLTLSAKDSNVFRSERKAAIELLGGKTEHFRSSWPHVSIGRIVIDSAAVNELKHYIADQLSELDEVHIQPVQSHY